MLFDIGQKSKSLIGKRIGFVRITEPQEYTQNYETAAWYKTSVSDLGDFDLVLRQDHLHKERLFVCAMVPATVTNNNFPTLFGGVPVGKGQDCRGERGDIPVKAIWPDVGDDHKSKKKGAEFVVELDHMDAAIEYAENAMRHYAEDFPTWYQTYLEASRNQFNSNISMVAHFGKNIAEYGDLLGRLLRRQEWRQQNPKYERTQRAPDEVLPEMVAV